MERFPALAMVAHKSLNGKFLAKLIFLQGVFFLPLHDANIGSLKFLHTLFDKYLDPMLVKFEQKRVVQTIQKFKLFDKKWLPISDKALTPFCKTYL